MHEYFLDAIATMSRREDGYHCGVLGEQFAVVLDSALVTVI